MVRLLLYGLSWTSVLPFFLPGTPYPQSSEPWACAFSHRELSSANPVLESHSKYGSSLGPAGAG